MLCKFKVNLGSVDAEPLGLDWAKCTAGSTVDCLDDAGAWLVKKGIAVDVSPPTPKVKPVPIVADPPKAAEELQADPPEVKPEAKPEPTAKKK